ARMIRNKRGLRRKVIGTAPQIRGLKPGRGITGRQRGGDPGVRSGGGRAGQLRPQSRPPRRRSAPASGPRPAEVAGRYKLALRPALRAGRAPVPGVQGDSVWEEWETAGA